MTENSVTQTQNPETKLSLDKNGINLSIEDIIQSDDETTIKLSMSNHQYDLSEEQIFKDARLNEMPMKAFKILKNNMGGHHVEAEIAFAKTEEGVFRITPAPEAEFIFDRLW